ncbi:MAG: acetyl-CoA carboxylase carboxyltransferase subunit beta, partial [Devosia sp.]|nr:acetyl-CoA carboxylase carboxyltransferase subunit beta [Devosia sp.]
HRHNLRSTIGSLAGIFTKTEPVAELASTAPLMQQVSLREVAAAAEGDDDAAAQPPAYAE